MIQPITEQDRHGFGNMTTSAQSEQIYLTSQGEYNGTVLSENLGSVSAGEFTRVNARSTPVHST